MVLNLNYNTSSDLGGMRINGHSSKTVINISNQQALMRSKMTAALWKCPLIWAAGSLGVKSGARAQQRIWIYVHHWGIFFSVVIQTHKELFCGEDCHKVILKHASRGICMPNARLQSQCTRKRQMKDRPGAMWGSDTAMFPSIIR